jgi:hypothetical protein
MRGGLVGNVWPSAVLAVTGLGGGLGLYLRTVSGVEDQIDDLGSYCLVRIASLMLGFGVVGLCHLGGSFVKNGQEGGTKADSWGFAGAIMASVMLLMVL